MSEKVKITFEIELPNRQAYSLVMGIDVPVWPAIAAISPKEIEALGTGDEFQTIALQHRARAAGAVSHPIEQQFRMFLRRVARDLCPIEPAP